MLSAAAFVGIIRPTPLNALDHPAAAGAGFVDVPVRGEWLSAFSDAVADPGGGLFAIAESAATSAGDFTRRSAVVKFDSAGRPDPTFGVGGVAILDDSPGLLAVVGPRLVVAVSGNPGVLYGFDRRGQLDHTFGQGGALTLDLNVTDLAVDGSERLVLLGQDRAGHPLIERRLLSGVVDASFNGSGTVDLREHAFREREVVAVAGDKVVVEVFGPDSSERLLRYTSSGLLDQTFGDGGVKDISDLVYVVNELAATSDGRPVVFGLGQSVVAGITRQYGEVVRLALDGSLDLSFGGDGVVEAGDSVFPEGGLLTSAGEAVVIAHGQIVRFTSTGGSLPSIMTAPLTVGALVDSEADGFFSVGDIDGFARLGVVAAEQLAIRSERFIADVPTSTARSMPFADGSAVVEVQAGRVDRLALFRPEADGVTVCDHCRLAWFLPVNGEALVWTSSPHQWSSGVLQSLRSDGRLTALNLAGGQVLAATETGKILWSQTDRGQVALVDVIDQSVKWSLSGEAALSFGEIDADGVVFGAQPLAEIHRLIPQGSDLVRDPSFGTDGVVRIADLPTGLPARQAPAAIARRGDGRFVLVVLTDFSDNMEDQSFRVGTVVLNARGTFEAARGDVVLSETRSFGRPALVDPSRFLAAPVLVTVDGVPSPTLRAIDGFFGSTIVADMAGRLLGFDTDRQLTRWDRAGQRDPSFSNDGVPSQAMRVVVTRDHVWAVEPRLGRVRFHQVGFRQPEGVGFDGLMPGRLFESRAGGRTVDGLGQAGGPRKAGSVTEMQVAGRGGVPPGVAGVALNVTAVDAKGDGYLTVWPCGTPQPNTSSVNTKAGVTVANAVLSGLSNAGRVCVYTSVDTDLVVDVTAVFSAASRFVGRLPGRLFESRVGGLTVDSAAQGIGARPAGSVTEIQVGGRYAVPIDADGVALNVTAVGARGDGYLTVWPCGAPRPNTSSINVSTGATIASSVVSGMGLAGRVCVYNSAETDLIVDVTGVFDDGSTLRGLTPGRLFESRVGGTTIDGRDEGVGLLAAGSTTEILVGGRHGVPADAAGVALTVTGVRARDAGFLTVWPCGSPRPNSSSVNMSDGATVANAVASGLGTAGTICVYASADTDAIVDVTGYFA